MNRTMKIMGALAAVSLLLLAACVPGPAEITTTPTPTPEQPAPGPAPVAQLGTIEIRATDPPPPGVSSANVTLTKVEVHLASANTSDNTSGWITVIADNVTFNLFDVIDDFVVLGSANVTPGKYTQIRMEVVSVVGLTSEDPPREYQATVPSGKLKIVKPFEVGEGGTTTLTLDFNGDKSLIETGQGKFLFKPVIKLAIEYEDGELEVELESEDENEVELEEEDENENEDEGENEGENEDEDEGENEEIEEEESEGEEE